MTEQECSKNNGINLLPGDHDLFMRARLGSENCSIVFRRARVKYANNPEVLHLIDTYDPSSEYSELASKLKTAYDDNNLETLGDLYDQIQGIYPDIQVD